MRPRTRFVLVPLALAAALAAAAPARGDEADDLRERLLKDPPSRWEAVMRSLERSPSRLGAALGPVFRDRGVRTPSAFAAAWLCDHAPRDASPLLVDEVLHRAQGDAAYVDEVRGFLAPEGPGWAALSAAARKRLAAAAEDPALGSAAAWILRYESTKPAAKDLAEAWASAPEQVKSVAAESLEAVLAYRFPGGAVAAKKWMAERDARPFVDWVRELSQDKDRPTAPVYARMLAEARANVQRAETPAELRRYLVPSETPWVEVRQVAAKRAAALQAPGDAWLPVLLQVLREESDTAALVAFLDVARQLRRTSGATAADLAKVVVGRLEECCMKPDLATGLLRVLGSVGDEATVAQAYDVVERATDVVVQEAWLSTAGTVGGNAMTIARFYRARQTRTDEPNVRLRVRALEALARGAGRTQEGDEVAAAVLRSVVRRAPTSPEAGGPPRETAPAARLAAVRGLESFPGPETVATLVEAARASDDDPAVAPLAVGVLGKLAPHSREAVTALVDVVRNEGSAAVRAEAAHDLAKALADGPEEARNLAATAVREALLPAAGSRVLRVAALQAAAAFADPDALAPAFALASEAAHDAPPTLGPDLQAALERLVQGVVRVDDRHDAAVAQGLEALGAAGGLDAAASVGDAAADAGAGRLRLQAARAGVLARRAAAASREPAARRDDLREADRVLRRAEQTATGPERTGEPWKAALLLHEAVLGSLLEDPALEPASRKAALMTSLDVAALRGDEPSARRALGLVDTIKALGLSAEESAELTRVAARLATAASPPPGPK